MGLLGENNLEIKSGRTRQNPDSSAPPSPGRPGACSLSDIPVPVPSLSCSQTTWTFSSTPALPVLFPPPATLLPHHCVSQLIPALFRLILNVTSSKEPSLKPQDWVDVLKCSFYYYSGTMMPTDQETVANENIVCYSSQEEGSRTRWRSTPVNQEAEGERRTHEQEPSLWFLREGSGEQGEQA